jgi:hypothetical protein
MSLRTEHGDARLRGTRAARIRQDRHRARSVVAMGTAGVVRTRRFLSVGTNGASQPIQQLQDRLRAAEDIR